MQIHHLKADHWVAISGSLNLTINGKDCLLTENKATCNPVGVVRV
ncbi:hypothetical protein [Gayadomonas joobiniege]